MGELGLNKIFGALLAVALAVMGLREISSMVFGSAHGEAHHFSSLNEWAEETFHGYRIELADSGGAEIIEDVYDLGLLLARADATRGERSFKAKCASCHTIEQDGGNSTGPNLFGTVGAAKQSHASFGTYSGALAGTEGDWTYANIDAWLESPAKYARGTSMGFAGLKRDDERANVIAYLATYSDLAPAFPEPLPAAAPEEAVIEGAAEDAAATNAAETDTAIIEAGEEAVVDTSVTETVDIMIDDAVEDGIETVTETVEEATEH